MGAADFCNTMKKETEPNVAGAFSRLVEAAAWDYGHAGYTGTIAEKHGFTTPVVIPDEHAEYNEILDTFQYRDEDDKLSNLGHWVMEKYGRTKYDNMIGTWNDKWGPALCLETSDRWIFTGLASS
jgi:hypothetical protein